MTVEILFDDRVGSAIIEYPSLSDHPITPSICQQVSIAAPFKSRYSRCMLLSRHIQVILAGLLLWFSIGFLVVTPIFLMCMLFSSQSWVLMASVMYGTIGLALDIATLIQEATLAEVREAVVILEGLSGVLNFLLIACGGYAFLSATMVGPPVATRPPNPPSPFSS